MARTIRSSRARRLGAGPDDAAAGSGATLDERDASDQAISAPHSRSVEEVLTERSGDRDGLTSTEAQRRLERVGPNRLPDPARENALWRIGKHFHDILIYILLVAVAVTSLLQHWIDAAVIFGVVVANAAIGYAQEGRAEQALAGIRELLSLDARVRRRRLGDRSCRGTGAWGRTPTPVW